MSGMQIFVKTFRAEPLPHDEAQHVWKAPAGTDLSFARPEVDAFSAETAEVELVGGLPAGVNVSAELLELISVARSLDRDRTPGPGLGVATTCRSVSSGGFSRVTRSTGWPDACTRESKPPEPRLGHR